jgi:hypothetical protein
MTEFDIVSMSVVILPLSEVERKVSAFLDVAA